MSFLRLRGVLVALLGGLVLIAACTPQQGAVDIPPTTTTPVDPPPTRFTLLLQSQRSRIIRDDDNQGAVDFTANTSTPSSIRWCAQLAGSTNTEECSGDCDIDAVLGLLAITCPVSGDAITSSRLQVTDVISDPGVSGTDIVVFVFATPEGDCTEDDGDCTQLSSSSLSVVRPTGSLQASGQSGSGGVANPGEVVRLIVDIEGGDPALFDVDICSDLTTTLDDLVSNGEVTIPATDRPYGVTWSVTAQLPGELSSRFDANIAFQGVLELCNNDGETRTQVDFAIPDGIVGELTFTIEATDSAGNTSSTSISLSVESATSLAIGDLSAGSTELLPDQQTDVVVALAGGECPYEVTFSLPATSAGTLTVDANAGCGAQAQTGVREIVCTVGGGDLNECSIGGSATVQYVAPQTPTSETVTVNVLDAVGATARDTVSIATTPAVSVAVIAGDSTIAPGGTTTISATISGGQPPYTVRFGTSSDAEELVRGTLVGESASCPSGNSVGSPDSTGAATCSDVPAACETVVASDIGTDGTATVVRKYCAAGNKAGNERVTVTVADALGERDTSVVGFTVAVEVELAVTLIADQQTLGLGDTTTLTADASGGIPPYAFIFVRVNDLGTLDPAFGDANQARYTAPNQNNTSPVIKVTVVDFVGGQASDSVTLFVNQVAQDGGPLSLNVQTGSEDLCAGDQRSIIATASGGNPPYSFSFQCQNCDAVDPAKGTLLNNVYTAPTDLPPNTEVEDIIAITVTDNAGVSQPSEITFKTTSIAPTAGVTNPVTTIICQGDTIQLDGETNITGDCTWNCGDGIFVPVQPAIQTVYTPGANDIIAGSVACTLTCPFTAPCLEDAVFDATTDILVVTVESPDRTTCVGETILLAPIVADVDEASCEWTGGNGVFTPDRMTLTATYDPTGAEETNGSVEITLTCDRLAPCAGDQSDIMTITFDANPEAVITLNPSGPNPADPATCEGSSGNTASVDALAPGVDATYAWTVNGGVIANGQNTPQITYSINASPGVDTAQISVTVTNEDTGCVSLGSVNLDVIDPSTCNDGNECTQDTCVAGACAFPPLASGTACGDGSDSECDNPDTCDGAGSCQDNNENAGFSCGDATNDDCTNADTCDGVGACQDNHENAGFACGDATNDDCTNADTCDGVGACQDNHESAGFTCGDATDNDCTNPDTCDGSGVCLVNHENDGFSCGDATNDACTDPDECDGAGNCDSNHEGAGTLCGDPANTDCTNPDRCDGAGVCEANHEVNGFACGDNTDDGCTDPDTCDGAGACEANHEANGFACGDATDDGCTDPDTCDGAGACLNNHEANGFACGDATDDNCTDPDTCDGAGSCLDNHEGLGTTCQDGLFCTDGDECDGAGACTPGAADPCPNPNQLCSEILDDCVECLSDLDCTNANRPACDPGSGVCEECVVDADCDDANDCTDDTCAGNSCSNTDFVAGTACGDVTDDGCTDPDTCDGAGACLDNHESAGFACGDPTDDDCTNADTCDGAGNCDANEELVGFACGDPTNDQCTDPDTCDGAGACLDNHEANGTACDDGTHCDGANGTDTCDGNGVCDPGTPPVCGDVCNEALDACTECEFDGDCAGGDICDGTGACVIP